MKNFKLVVLALMISTTGLFANNLHVKKSAPLEIEKNIILKLSVNTEAEVVVLRVDSKDNDVLSYVRENLNGQKIDDAATVKAFQKQKEVSVTFSVNSDSEIVVLSVSTSNNYVLNFVRENVNGHKI